MTTDDRRRTQVDERATDDREERLARVADVLAGVDERIAAEDAAAAHPA